ncbi:MAG: hypothetical protein AB1324_03340 [Candidatus Micrarchaeota archaeon]
MRQRQRETIFHKEAKRRLLDVLKHRSTVEPKPIMPQKIDMVEFTYPCLRHFPWATFDEGDAEIMFSYGFIERRREDALRLGIIYERKITDAVPPRYRTKVLEQMRRWKAEIEESIACRRPGQMGAPSMEDYMDAESMYLVRLTPLRLQDRFLNHDRAAFKFDGNLRPDRSSFIRFLKLLEAGIVINPGIGDPEKSFTYLKKYEEDAGDMGGFVYGEGEVEVRFHIDVRKLAESRTIFADPECMGVRCEYGKTFMVRGGIPVNAIYDWSIWEGEEPPPKPA